MADDSSPTARGSLAAGSRFRARSYELDSFGHVNHAVFLNWFEQARFETLEAAGHPADELVADGWAVVVVRVEVDYRAEVLLGDDVVIRTRLAEARGTSMTLVQRAVRGERGEEEAVAEARVVAVWMKDGRPTRIPDDVRAALGAPPRRAGRASPPP
ncbi:MAG: thioesterase family protein [Gemmatimonadota bacterium]|jgi:YbgC/YbaW family acyl-CoA thioester hydrolase